MVAGRVLLAPTRPDGVVSADGRVWGTYLHGLFDAGQVRRALVHEGAAASLVPLDYRDLREREYDRLAAVLRGHIDLGALQALVGLK